MEIYILIKMGVYINDIIGIFDDSENTKEIALTMIKNEPDDYHTFYVYKRTLNNIDDEILLYEIYREGVEIKVKTGGITL